jgi:hypothetical protein
MPATYEPIATTTLGSATNTISFSSIPSTYTDLKIILVGTVSSAATPCMRFNGITTATYSGTQLQGNGTGAVTSRSSGDGLFYTNLVQNWSTTVPGFLEIDIFSYTNSIYKTCLIKTSKDENGYGMVTALVGLWQNTASISSITLFPESQNWSVNTRATLYGILKA